MLHEPVGELEEVGRHGVEGAGFLIPALGRFRNLECGGDGLLVDIQASAVRVNDFHVNLVERRLRLTWILR